MPVRKYKPTSPGRRFMATASFEEITATEPEKSLLESLPSQAGRNNQGRITVRHRGGDGRRAYRRIDFKRDKLGVPGKVATIEDDPHPPGPHRARQLSRRREALHPGAAGPQGGRPDHERARGADPSRQRAAAG